MAGISQESFFSHLAQSPPDHLVLYCNWDSVTNLKKDTEFQGQVVVYETSGNIVPWRAQISSRGKYRRAKCDFPPLEINLKKGELRERGYLDFDKLKLVTHCTTDNDSPEDLYEELMIYQLYASLTPESFHVIPLKIDYLYEDGKPYVLNAMALLLEPTAEVVHRLGGRELEQYSVPEDSLDAESYCRTALFEFMIGNFDWNPTLQRNVKMIGQPGHYHLVPYDFDFSAIVAPRYMRIPPDLGLTDVRDRIYLGTYFETQLPDEIARFETYRDGILTYVQDFPYLSQSRRKDISKYLEAFFDYIAKPGTRLKNGTKLRYK